MKKTTLLAVVVICATCCYCTHKFCQSWFGVAAVKAGINVIKKK